MNRLLALLLRPIGRLALQWVKVPDPWERVDIRFPVSVLGMGARYEFDWFFEGESAVPIGSLHELRSWLRGCRYMGDPELFHERDYWQHPRTFEQLKRGDCEDFAIWSWRKLVEIGMDADLVFGRCLPLADPPTSHAWVVFRDRGTTFVMEPTSARHADWVRPLAEARDSYRPHFGVTARREHYCFAGWLLTAKEGPVNSRNPRRAAPGLPASELPT